jgi:spoIIIJ-associated protein
MAKQTHEFRGKSVDEAVDEGLRVLALAKNEVDVEIVQKGSRGIFGLGSEPAIVRLTPRTIVAAKPAAVPTPLDVAPPAAASPTVEVESPTVTTSAPAETTVAPEVSAAPPLAEEATPPAESVEPVAEVIEAEEPASMQEAEEEVTDASADEDEADQVMMEMASDLLRQMVHLMGFEAEIRASWQEEDGSDDDRDEEEEEEEQARAGRYLLLDIEGADLGALIGRRGETLENMQYLLRLMVNQKIHKWKNIVIDVEHYKARRVTQLTQLAERMADQVARTGRAISLEPMPANERRIVHMTLRDHPDVYTESYGDGGRRKVHIFAKS